MGRNRDNTNLRVPTLDEFQAFTGAHCHNIYQTLPLDWRCPGCDRSRFEVLRWTMLFPKLPSRHEGWAGGFHVHHDHGPEHLGGPARFERTVVCEQCNSADATAKRRLKLPTWFSFAPSEIRRFVRPTAHGFHEVDYDGARDLFDAAIDLGRADKPGSMFW
jgi:hypothetical protein